MNLLEGSVIHVAAAVIVAVVAEPAVERPKLPVLRGLLCYSGLNSLLPALLQMRSARTEVFAVHVLPHSAVVDRVKSVKFGHSTRNLS